MTRPLPSAEPASSRGARGAPARPRPGLSRRRVAVKAGAGVAGMIVAACGPLPAAPGRQSSALAGTFELLSQNWPPQNQMHEAAIASFQEKHPDAKVTFTPVGYGEISTKVRASIAAGAGPDGFFHYSGFWRGVQAHTIMLPLTPQLFRRNELAQITFPNMLNAVPARDDDVYFLPHSVGMNGSMLLYNASLLQNAGVDPKGLTTLDAVLQAAGKLVERQGGTVTRAGLLPISTANLIMRWILDQGAKFYDERNHTWNWQTTEAERAMQWILDLYDRHGVAWRTQPESVKDPLGEGHAAMATHGAYALSGYAASFPDVRLEDQPLPGFVAGKQPHYYEPEIAGYSLSALLKPDDAKAKIGAAFFKHLLAPDSAIALANVYSGAILVKDVYTDPRFKETKFGAGRARLPEQIISKAVLIPTSANPYTVGTYMNKVIAGELSIKSALAEMQQTYNVEEEEARRNMG